MTLLGGGGFRVPLVYQALLNDHEPGRVTQLRLYDRDRARLAAIAQVLAGQAARPGVVDPPTVSVHTDLTEAIAGTDFVFSAIRVGGLAGRVRDERVALDHGVIGQETVGAGGISYALRTVPVVLNLAEQIRRHAPEAWVISFTNPAGVITEAMTRLLGDRVIGICDSPVGLARRAQAAAGVAGRPASIGYAGLNHLGWLRSLTVDGTDVVPRLLGDLAALGSFEEGRLFGPEWIQALGALPNEYLQYYYFSRETLAADLEATPRGAYLQQQQQRFYDRFAGDAPADPLAAWDEARLERERTYMATNRHAAGDFERDETDLVSGGYDQVALAIMHAIGRDVPAELIVNVPNRGTLPALDDDAIVEVPCRVDRTGAHPLPNPGLPAIGVGLVTTVKQVERLTIEAATTGSRRAAWLAFALHPLVDSARVAHALLDGYLDAFDELAYLR